MNYYFIYEQITKVSRFQVSTVLSKANISFTRCFSTVPTRDRLRLLASEHFHRLDYRSMWALLTSGRMKLAEKATAAATKGGGTWGDPVLVRAEVRTDPGWQHRGWCDPWSTTPEGVRRIEVEA